MRNKGVFITGSASGLGHAAAETLLSQGYEVVVHVRAQVLVVNVVAPYLLTALIQRPQHLIYLSSSMHTGGRTNLSGMDWTGRTSTGSYSDSKLFVTTLGTG